MTAGLLAPLAIAMILAVLVTAVHRRLPPTIAARAVTTTMAVVAAAGVPTLWILSLGYVAHVPLLGGRLDWCAEAWGVHDPIPAWLGVPALILSGAGILRVRTVLRSYRRLRQNEPGAVEFAEHALPFAFTLPGRGGQVVVSTGLVDILDEHEQQVVLAHERAHAVHRHDRYLLIAQVAAALMPPLRTLASRLQFSLERWADEAAVDHCGDRRFVARTLGKVALSSVSPAFAALSFAGLGVPARVAALLSPPRPPVLPRYSGTLWCAIAVTGVLAAFQIHHLALLLTALCPT